MDTIEISFAIILVILIIAIIVVERRDSKTITNEVETPIAKTAHIEQKTERVKPLAKIPQAILTIPAPISPIPAPNPSTPSVLADTVTQVVATSVYYPDYIGYPGFDVYAAQLQVAESPVFNTYSTFFEFFQSVQNTAISGFIVISNPNGSYNIGVLEKNVTLKIATPSQYPTKTYLKRQAVKTTLAYENKTLHYPGGSVTVKKYNNVNYLGDVRRDRTLAANFKKDIGQLQGFYGFVENTEASKQANYEGSPWLLTGYPVDGEIIEGSMTMWVFVEFSAKIPHVRKILGNMLWEIYPGMQLSGDVVQQSDNLESVLSSIPTANDNIIGHTFIVAIQTGGVAEYEVLNVQQFTMQSLIPQSEYTVYRLINIMPSPVTHGLLRLNAWRNCTLTNTVSKKISNVTGQFAVKEGTNPSTNSLARAATLASKMVYGVESEVYQVTGLVENGFPLTSFSATVTAGPGFYLHKYVGVTLTGKYPGVTFDVNSQSIEDQIAMHNSDAQFTMFELSGKKLIAYNALQDRSVFTGVNTTNTIYVVNQITPYLAVPKTVTYQVGNESVTYDVYANAAYLGPVTAVESTAQFTQKLDSHELSSADIAATLIKYDAMYVQADTFHMNLCNNFCRANLTPGNNTVYVRSSVKKTASQWYKGIKYYYNQSPQVSFSDLTTPINLNTVQAQILNDNSTYASFINPDDNQLDVMGAIWHSAYGGALSMSEKPGISTITATVITAQQQNPYGF